MLMDRGLSVLIIAQDNVSIVSSRGGAISATGFLDIHQSLLPRLLLISRSRMFESVFLLDNFDHLRFLAVLALF